MFSLPPEPLNSIVSVPSWPSTHVAAVARIPLEDVVAGAQERDVVALLAVDEVVAVAAEQDVDAVAAEDACRCRHRRRR